jgi:hypothetical protein
MERKFTLTEKHIKLLRAMYVGWSQCEFGAPEINPKRPYGNSFVIGDIHEILSEDPSVASFDDEILEELVGEYHQLHRETETALQVILRTGSFKPGTYKCDPYKQNWQLIEGA